MDAKIKAQWVDALISGKYKQGNGYLKTEVSNPQEEYYCCLGVLCAIQNADFSDFTVFQTSMGTVVVPPRYRAGLEQADCDILAYKNDSGVTFSGIAEWIEDNL